MLLTKNKFLRIMGGFIETASILTIKLLIKKPSRVRSLPTKLFLQYMALVENDTWCCKDISEILHINKNMRISVEHCRGEGIETPIIELATLALSVAWIRPHRIFEIGTFRGRTALNFALNTDDNCHIYTLDIPPEERNEFKNQTNPTDAKIIDVSVTGIDYKGSDVENKITQLLGNSLTFDFSPYFNQMDFVFVDGAHDYNSVKSDTLNALNMVKKNGYILWDDFATYGEYNGVTRAILELIPKNKLFHIAETHYAIYRHDA